MRYGDGQCSAHGGWIPSPQAAIFSTAFTSEKALGRVQVPHEMFVKYL